MYTCTSHLYITDNNSAIHVLSGQKQIRGTRAFHRNIFADTGSFRVEANPQTFMHPRAIRTFTYMYVYGVRAQA